MSVDQFSRGVYFTTAELDVIRAVCHAEIETLERSLELYTASRLDAPRFIPQRLQAWRDIRHKLGADV